ncbi:MAG TPA: hypothetical protein DDZ91_11980 [Firmicutes bacterium]|jgi:hypothetical protein|nr:hypothetical protein [Bacillota bacterium]
MLFKDDQHRAFYNSAIEETNSQNDRERKALFYTLGLTSETKNNINHLYGFQKNYIRPEGLKKSWQTGATIRICRLAFNLYNGTYGDDLAESRYYTPYNLFDYGLLMPYMLEAVKILYVYK